MILLSLFTIAHAGFARSLLPEFTQTSASAWINSEPLSRDDLLGKVTLIDIWTFDCWNCYRSFPWLREVEKKYSGKGFQIIGIHSPEFDHEHERDRVEAKVKEFELHHPVMMDNDFSYWRALGNRYWPTYYLVDTDGYVRARYIGETHVGDQQAAKIESEIEALLKE